MEKTVKKRKKKKFLLFLEGIVKIFYRKRKTIGEENVPNEACMIISNHSQIHGPLAGELFLKNKLIWCDGPMMNRKEVPEYTARVFWKDKPKKSMWFYKMLGHLIARPASYILGNADTIGVFRDTRLFTTFKTTVDALKDGTNIVIYPECPVERNEIVNEFNLHFVDTARMYYKETGKCLAFVPMYHAVKLKKFVYGKPIYFDPSIDNVSQRTRICNYLMDEITALAKSLPRHKVIPFNNVGKKNFKYSKEK